METVADFARNFRDIGLVVISIFTGFSLAIATLEKYSKSKKYNIPFNLSQINIHDFVDIWIELFTLLGIGIILPFAASIIIPLFTTSKLLHLLFSISLNFTMVVSATLVNKFSFRLFSKKGIWIGIFVLAFHIIISTSVLSQTS